MGIETAALLAGAASAGAGTAAAAVPAAAALAGTTAAGTAAAAGAGATAATAAGAGAAGAASTGIAAGSLEAANLVGAIGGDSLGAFIAANQGFGTMSAAESAMGMMSAIGDSPIISGITDAGKASASEPTPQAQKPAPSVGPNLARPNQNPGLTAASGLMQSPGGMGNPSDLEVLGFADGGTVPSNALAQMFSQNIFERTRQKREEEAGLTQSQPASGVTINIGSGGTAKQEGNVPRTEAPTPSIGEFADSVLKLIKMGAGYQDGGAVRTGSSDVKAGGEIRGPKSKTGKDNQIIKVAGGEGILPVDVMEVPGVADLVQNLIQTFHTPVRK